MLNKLKISEINLAYFVGIKISHASGLYMLALSLRFFASMFIKDWFVILLSCKVLVRFEYKVYASLLIYTFMR